MDQSNATPSIFQVYFNRRMAVLAGLGLASGLPYMLTGAVLQAWMTDAHVTLGTIGLFSLVTLPYTFKFCWAPFMDRYALPILGRRRGWLLLMQLLLIAAIAAMALTGPSRSLLLFAIMAMLLAFLSASQDIVADAYRTDVLPEAERGAGAAVYVTGYRIAMLLSSSLGIWLVGRYGVPWPMIYLGIAAMMSLGIVATLAAPEPRMQVARPEGLADAFIDPLFDFLRRPDGWLVLLFVVVFKLPDVLVDGMKMPFLLQIGISKEQIGAIGQGLGLAMSIAGALVGGGLVARLGLWRSLWVFGLLQALSNLGFWVLSQTGPNLLTLSAVISVENFCAGLVTAGFVAFLMSQCDVRFSATQYAMLSSLMAVTRIVGGAPAGFLAEHLGWPAFFLASLFAAVPGLLLLTWVRPRPRPQHEDRGFEVLPLTAPIPSSVPSPEP